ncbi:unnamed protein product [Owenia fusiformis]|uniref:Uncharacterized protein n=1 Tax=Owenia fusiformis TaxID=6347 RepID=A0A8J1XGC2_OWEFU|nr:unnamed protein product [Owenia fusiformis]
MDLGMDETNIPQSEPMEVSQVQNKAGGFVWKVDDIQRLRRFLCFGSESGTYYSSPKELGLENAKVFLKLIKEGKGKDIVKVVRDFSVDGRTAKQDSIIFALALCARSEDTDTKAEAYKVLNEVCRIPTHLFAFVQQCEKLSKGTGWGRAHRRAVSSWYTQFSDKPKKLANHITKYRNRNGWTHKDLLRLSHMKTESDSLACIFKYIVKGIEATKETYENEKYDSEDVKDVLDYLCVVEMARISQDEQQLKGLIMSYQLVREHIPTNMLNSKVVWSALLVNMPMTAMIRNLSKMSSIGLLEKGSEEEKIIVDCLNNEMKLRQARIHPFNVLVALFTYSKGAGERGKLKWPVNLQVTKALDTAYHLSFKFVEPTNKRYCLAVDVSGSMCSPVLGTAAITCRDASAAMMMTTARTETNYEVVAFSQTLKKMDIRSEMQLQQVISEIKRFSMGGTDCAQPMLWAKKYKKEFDVFIVYTDCETWAGAVHPAEALRQYRKAMNIWDAKLIVCAMTSNGFTLADPEDPGMLDMSGFDSAAPNIMSNFILGKI